MDCRIYYSRRQRGNEGRPTHKASSAGPNVLTFCRWTATADARVSRGGSSSHVLLIEKRALSTCRFDDKKLQGWSARCEIQSRRYNHHDSAGYGSRALCGFSPSSSFCFSLATYSITRAWRCSGVMLDCLSSNSSRSSTDFPAYCSDSAVTQWPGSESH